jgi:hypothetical protein
MSRNLRFSQDNFSPISFYVLRLNHGHGSHESVTRPGGFWGWEFEWELGSSLLKLPVLPNRGIFGEIYGKLGAYKVRSIRNKDSSGQGFFGTIREGRWKTSSHFFPRVWIQDVVCHANPHMLCRSLVKVARQSIRWPQPKDDAWRELHERLLCCIVGGTI